MKDLSIIKRTYNLILWYVPILNQMPKDHKFVLGDRVITGLYDLLEGFIIARYTTQKLPVLEGLNAKLDIIRHESRLLVDFKLFDEGRYNYVGGLINEIGNELGGWIRQQRNKEDN